MAEEAGQSDAARRAAARKAKILARGNAGLAKLAQTARGEEAEKLYGDASASSSKPATPSASRPETPNISSGSAPQPSQTAQSPPWAPPSGANSAGASRQLSEEQQRMAEQLNNMMSMFGMPPPGSEQPGQMPDISQLLAQMMGGAQGGPGLGGQNLLGDLDDPAGLGGLGGGGLPPGFPNLPLDGMPGFPGLPGMPGLGVPAGKTWVERVFPLVHFLGMLLLLAFTVIWWEPSLWSRRNPLSLGGWSDRWAALAGHGKRWELKSFSGSVVEVLPVFWAFVTFELILQTTRFFVLRSPPRPHSLLNNFLPLLPPKISRPLITGSRYLSLISQTYKDACLLVFGVGMLVVLAEYVK